MTEKEGYEIIIESIQLLRDRIERREKRTDEAFRRNLDDHTEIKSILREHKEALEEHGKMIRTHQELEAFRKGAVWAIVKVSAIISAVGAAIAWMWKHLSDI